MNRKRLVASAAAAAVLTLGAGGAGIAYATGSAGDAGSDSGEQRATGPGIEKAKSVALDHTGGRVTGIEVEDEEGYYEVEVTRDDGTQVDVHLDRNLNVLGTPADRDGSNDEGGSNDR